MLKRIITALVGLAVFAVVIFAHQYVLYAAVAAIIMGMLYEMYGVTDTDKRVKITGFCAALMLIVGFVINKAMFSYYGAIMLFMLMMVVLHKKVKSSEVLSAAAVTLFIATCMLSLVLIRKYCDKYTVILPFICAWLTDTGAYFTGTFFGKHKLVPEISPKKTVEGAIGGIVLSTIGSALYIVIMCLLMAGGMPKNLIILKFALLGFGGSVVSQIGDLIASCIKRDYGKKDYGSILPGHGGLLDRFDSVIFVSPFVYYAMGLFIL